MATTGLVPAFRTITDEVKAAGAVILQQLYHIDAHGDSDLNFAPHRSPSGGPSYHESDGRHAMTGAEVEELLEAHVAAEQLPRRRRSRGASGRGGGGRQGARSPLKAVFSIGRHKR
ncbi:MAG: hypothetical protein ACK4GM_07870 [Tabrizicola sp.]